MNMKTPDNNWSLFCPVDGVPICQLGLRARIKAQVPCWNLNYLGHLILSFTLIHVYFLDYSFKNIISYILDVVLDTMNPNSLNKKGK